VTRRWGHKACEISGVCHGLSIVLEGVISRWFEKGVLIDPIDIFRFVMTFYSIFYPHTISKYASKKDPIYPGKLRSLF
jgi:hypothetical protein